MNRRSFIQNSALTFGALTLAQQKNTFSIFYKRQRGRSAAVDVSYDDR